MSIFSHLRGRIGFGELILIILLGLLGAAVWHFWSLPAFVIQDVQITHQDDQINIRITPLYRGGCETVRLSQWIEFAETGEIRQLSDYSGKPRAKIGVSEVGQIVRLGRALKPGDWIWHAEAICTHANGRQEQFRAPPTPFFVEGPA